MRGPRFDSKLSDDAAQLNASIDFDQRLLPFDAEGSKAHARMLAQQGILSHDDAEAIARGLDQVVDEWRRGALTLDAQLEDVHMNVEWRLTEIVGDAGARLHTARSRNDQVATDLRLYARAQASELSRQIAQLQRALVKQARAHVDTLMPGYTHLQRAQPVRLAHHLMAYVEMLARDRGRLADAAKRMNESPLGSGALAATTFPIDRDATAKALGFARPTANSLDAVGDRDFAVELVAACALLLAHLSRMGEELVLWASQEFGFVRLPEAYCSGSSIMPQKVNPDVPELVRAKVARVIGDLTTLLVVLKGLPLAYNKDLQETQEPLYDAVETAILCTRTMAGLIAGTAFEVERMQRAVGQGHLLATEVADWLAARGVPFRQAHAAAGALVRMASARGVELAALTLDDLRATAPDVTWDEGLFAVLDAARAVDRRDVVGGPARTRVMQAIETAERELSKEA
ncbi:MAG: argininosuccinate lyase [Myxococcales bacterium]|nr:argininosuccinate lyase [Myxococcales bacterium]